MTLGDVVDQLHDDDRLADTRAAEKADLPAFYEWRDQIDDLDARLEDLGLGLQVREQRSRTMDRPALDIRGDRRSVVHRLTEYVENSTQRGLADRNLDRRSGIFDVHPAHDGVRRGHRDGAHLIATDVLLHFDRHIDVGAGIRFLANAERVVKLRQVLRFEFDVEYGADHLHDPADVLRRLRIGIRSGGLLSLGTNGCCHDLSL